MRCERSRPRGFVAGIFARTDATRGVWKAPAGTEASLTGAAGLAITMSDAENGQLNPLGDQLPAHPAGLRQRRAGARARSHGDNDRGSEWKYVPVRRMALFLEESLYRGTQWVVFEPNDEPLWAQIRLNIGAFMQDLFRQGAFQGTTPREAYFVKCDRETTTQADINLGIVNILVGFAPLKPAEFVVLKIQQIAGEIADLRRRKDSTMAQFSVNPQRFDPYKNFKFRVKWDGRYVAGISKVSALKRTTEVVEHREGGDPSTGRKSPGRTKYEAITLERGVTHDLEFEHWANKVWNFGSGLGAEVSLQDFRKDIIIEFYNEAGQLAIAYKVFRCWVSEFQALPDLDANANAVAIQTLKLENEGWERDLDVTEPAEPQLHRAGMTRPAMRRQRQTRSRSARSSTCGSGRVGLDRWRRDDALLALACAAAALGARNAALLAIRNALVRSRLAAAEPLPGLRRRTASSRSTASPSPSDLTAARSGASATFEWARPLVDRARADSRRSAARSRCRPTRERGRARCSTRCLAGDSTWRRSTTRRSTNSAGVSSGSIPARVGQLRSSSARPAATTGRRSLDVGEALWLELQRAAERSLLTSTRWRAPMAGREARGDAAVADRGAPPICSWSVAHDGLPRSPRRNGARREAGRRRAAVAAAALCARRPSLADRQGLEVDRCRLSPTMPAPAGPTEVAGSPSPRAMPPAPSERNEAASRAAARSQRRTAASGRHGRPRAQSLRPDAGSPRAVASAEHRHRGRTPVAIGAIARCDRQAAQSDRSRCRRRSNRRRRCARTIRTLS